MEYNYIIILLIILSVDVDFVIDWMFLGFCFFNANTIETI